MKVCNQYHLNSGFTLVELMIALVIIGILVSIAYPSYVNYVDSSRRAEGISALVAMASEQERFYTSNSDYASTIANMNVGAMSETGLYTVSTAYDGGNTDTYTLTAAPTGWNDANCGSLTLTSAGGRGATPVAPETIATCWGN